MVDATVIIAAWNAADTLPRSVASAQAQSAIACEIVVADDASSDNTAQIAQEMSGVHLERLAQNGGPAVARNRAIDVAQGAWIAVLDSDDTMAPGRLAHMIEFAKQHGADIVLDSFYRQDPDGTLLESTDYLDGVAIENETAISLETYLRHNASRPGTVNLGYLKPLISKEFIDRTGLRYNPDLRNSEDTHLIIEALANGARVAISRAPDYRYTVRPGSISYRVNPDHLQALIAADAAFVARRGGDLSPQARALFGERKSALEDMMQGERVMQALKARRPMVALSTLASRPKTLKHVVRQLSEAVRKRLSRRAGSEG